MNSADEWNSTQNDDSGSLLTSHEKLKTGERLQIEGEPKIRQVTHVMGSEAKGWRATFAGQGAVPEGQVHWRKIRNGPPQVALDLINDLRSQLEEIVTTTRGTHDFNIGDEQLKRWKARAIQKLTEEINPGEGKKLKSKYMSTFQMDAPMSNFAAEAKMYDSFLFALSTEIDKHPEGIFKERPPTETQENLAVRTPEGNAIFIVHGHDELNLLRLKDHLRDRYMIETIVLAKKAGKGRSIIEKFEEEAQRATYAFVLLTPDDLIRKDDTEYSQARPNVLFELGWFYGRLGRGRVCILFKEGTRLLSDLDGISRVEFTESVLERAAEIEQELIAGHILL